MWQHRQQQQRGAGAVGAASNAPASLQSQSFSYSSPSAAAAAAAGSRSPPVSSLAPPLLFPVSSFSGRPPRFLSNVQARLTVLRHKHAKVRINLAELMRFLCIPRGQRKSRTSTSTSTRPSPPSLEQPPPPYVMPPLREVIAAPAPATTTSAAATASSSATEPAAAATAVAAHPTHLRYQGQPRIAQQWLCKCRGGVHQNTGLPRSRVRSVSGRNLNRLMNRSFQVHTGKHALLSSLSGPWADTHHVAVTQLAIWSVHAPPNYLCKWHLLQAERA